MPSSSFGLLGKAARVFREDSSESRFTNQGPPSGMLNPAPSTQTILPLIERNGNMGSRRCPMSHGVAQAPRDYFDRASKIGPNTSRSN